MEGQERFAKCFVIISVNCKLWILNFVENRIQQVHGKTLIDFINSSPDLANDKIVKEFLERRKTSSSSEIKDISALCAVITTGKLLKPVELKSVGHQNNTTGDQIDRILKIRNIFMDTAEANLDESDYDGYINDFKEIGQHFEVTNCENNGTYTMQIEEIHDTPFDPSEMEHIVIRHKRYVEMAIKEGKERFAKCFVIIVENCKSWTLKFAENRIQQKNGQTLEQFINSTPEVRKDKMVSEFLKNQKSEIDITSLCVVINTGKLLTRAEKYVGHHNNTIGDLIDRIRNIRNIFVHCGEAHLDESEYNFYINKFKDIGKHFERINGATKGTYTQEIEEIHDKLFDTSKVERIVVRYKEYVDRIWTIEIPALIIERSAPVEERPAPEEERPEPVEEIPAPEEVRPSLPNCRCYHCRHGHSTDCACYYCSHYRFVNCQCYHCCHHLPFGCQCKYCREKRDCIIM